MGGFPQLGAYVAINEAPLSVLDARIGAVGDGVTDNATAFAKIPALLTSGGELSFPPGVYASSLYTSPTDAAYKTLLAVPPKVTVRGFGERNTTIKVLGSQPAGDLIINAHPTAGTDSDITFEGFTLDGSAAAQSGTQYHQGLCLIRGRNYQVRRVTVQNCYGTVISGGPAENGGFLANLCADIVYEACTAFNDSGSMADGFQSNGCTNLRRLGCTSRNMSVGMGYSDYQSAMVSHHGCSAYLNAKHGFNLEQCDEALYSACFGGGIAGVGMDGSPFTASQHLGNTGDGFVMNGSTRFALLGCQGRYNGGNGLTLANNYAALSGNIMGGSYSDNAGIGIAANVAAVYGNVFADSTVECLRNTTAQYSAQAGGPGYGNLHGQQPTPVVPATGTSQESFALTPVTVYVSGGSVTLVQYNGTAVGLTSGAVRLNPGDNIKVFYSSAPSWVWVAD